MQPDRQKDLAQRPSGVSAPVEQRGINHLAMNCLVPGLGSLARGARGTGMAQLGLALIGVFIVFSGHFILGPLLMLSAYGWSIATGVGFLLEKKDRLEWK